MATDPSLLGRTRLAPLKLRQIRSLIHRQMIRQWSAYSLNLWLPAPHHSTI